MDIADGLATSPHRPAPPGPEELAALRRRTTGVLVAGQILGGLGVAVGVALSPLLARQVGGTEAVAGLAPTATVAGTALLSVPLAALMTARGRRPGLVLGYLIGAAGAGVVVAGAVLEHFALLLAGMAAFGASSCANLQSRFAAADLAEPGRRARAISLVVWATTIGAVLGPNLAAPAGRSVAGLGVPEAAGPFLWAGVVFLAAALLVAVLLRPDPLLTARALAPEADRTPKGRSFRAAAAAVRTSPQARLALAVIAVSHTVMVSVMSMTPVELGHHGAGIELIGLVISGHIAGMYAFSPLMGRLADRGRLPVIGLCVALLGCAALLAGTAGASHGRTAAGLFVLGLGWSAGLVAGSALLTDAVPQGVRPAVQGLSDLTMNASAGIGGAVAGLVMAGAGYGVLNLLAAALLLPLTALTLFTALTRAPAGESAGHAEGPSGPAQAPASSPEERAAPGSSS
ncbi:MULTISPECIES: MFS transporter [Streptomyces]|uniref:MFS transporter n=1 Tax=Streptomyces TaxID=1883 RepID=UPI000525FEC3|nr:MULTISPECIES: MFS transporter [Streptomyces]MYQ73338.1 MFS transporter [Streptomyces sp. SID4934]MCX4443522.1 MFS transporter [Streptomyces albidoflavus]MCX5460638.1 MFS transporter [Streptomyces sp. FT1]RZD82858.1 MFS transporter [Streptomyces albidoflavus]WTB74748.1 MFS transporter [Streptomyces albidoflavus]